MSTIRGRAAFALAIAVSLAWGAAARGQLGPPTGGITGECWLIQSGDRVQVSLWADNGTDEAIADVTAAPLELATSGSASLTVVVGPRPWRKLFPRKNITFKWSGRVEGSGSIDVATGATAEDSSGARVSTGLVPCGRIVLAAEVNPTPTFTPERRPHNKTRTPHLKRPRPPTKTFRPTRTPVIHAKPTRIATKPPRPTRTPIIKEHRDRGPTKTRRPTRTPIIKEHRDRGPTKTRRPTRTPIIKEHRDRGPTKTRRPTRTPIIKEHRDRGPTKTRRPTRTPIIKEHRDRGPTKTRRPTRTPIIKEHRDRGPTKTRRPTRTPIIKEHRDRGPTKTRRPTRTPIIKEHRDRGPTKTRRPTRTPAVVIQRVVVCALTIREFVGRPSSDPMRGLPNGELNFVTERCVPRRNTAAALSFRAAMVGGGAATNTAGIRNAHVEWYSVTGNTLEDALRTIRLKKGPKGPDGKRWMGQTALTAELTYETSPSQDGSKLIVRVLNVRFDITVTLPYWDAAEGDEQAWNNLLGRLKKHEQGHVDRMRAGETQVKQQVIGTTFEIDKNATEQETVAAALSRVRGSQAYKDMEKANEDYDAPYDPENNPEGTNHGTENGQNVRPPHVGESGEEQAGEEEAGDGDGDEPDFDPRGFRVVPNTPETVTQCILAGGDPLRFRFRVENRTGAPLRNVTPQFVPTDGAPAAKFKRFVIPSKRNFLNGHSFRFEAITNFTRPYDNIAVTFEVVAQGPNGEEVKTGEFGCHAFD